MDDERSIARLRGDLSGPAHGRLRLRDNEAAPDDPSGDAEARMRQALGLSGARSGGNGHGGTPHGGTSHGGGSGAAGARRHRFVQDGEVPVSVIRPRPQAAGRGGIENERAADELAQERQLRFEAERRLADKEAQCRSLQTRIGLAELERDQALAEIKALREKLEERAAAASGESTRKPRRRDLDGGPQPDLLEPAAGEPEPVKWWL